MSTRKRSRTAQAALGLILAIHNADGYRYYGRLPGQPMPDPEGEAYCTHCNKPAPCPTVQAANATEPTRRRLGYPDNNGKDW